MSDEEKAARLIEIRTLAEVQQDKLTKAKLELYAAEDKVVRLGIEAHYHIGLFRDKIRAIALEKAKAEVNALLHLQKGEDIHFANRARSINAIDKINNLVWVGNNRQNSLSNLPKLRRFFTERSALA